MTSDELKFDFNPVVDALAQVLRPFFEIGRAWAWDDVRMLEEFRVVLRSRRIGFNEQDLQLVLMGFRWQPALVVERHG